MTLSNLTLTIDPSTVHNTPARKLRSLLALIVLSAAACEDMEDLSPESELEVESAIEQPEPVLAASAEDEEEPAAPGDATPIDGIEALSDVPNAAAGKHSMCCELEFDDPFQIRVRIVNPGPTVLTECSDFFAGQHQITYKVNHTYGSPAPFVGTTAPIPLGSSRYISLSHPGYLNALSCEAFYTT